MTEERTGVGVVVDKHNLDEEVWRGAVDDGADGAQQRRPQLLVE